MINERSAEWKKLHRELKILRARKAASGRLLPKEEQRLQFLEQTLGDASEVKRIEVTEEASTGATRTTADGAFATEVSEDLLGEAEEFKAEKAWEKDVQRGPKAKVVSDSREGKATFKQKGLSPFAVDLADDLKGLGLEEEQAEEEPQPHQPGMGRSFQIELGDETPVAGQAAPANPFAIQLDDGLSARLEREAARAPQVPDLVDRARQADFDVEPEPEVPTRADDLDPELQALLRKTGGITAGEAADRSRGARTSFEVDGGEESTRLDDQLLRQALQEAEQKGLVVEETQTWAVDEQGRELEVTAEPETTQALSAFDLPPPAPAPRFAAGDTTPGADVAPEPSVVRPEPTLANVPVETQAEGSPAGLMEGVPDISDDIPDISDAAEAELGLFVEPEDEPPARRAQAEPDYDYQKAMHDDLAAVPEFEAEDLSQVSRPGATQATASELDSFWGLAEDAPAAPPPPSQARPAARPRPEPVSAPFPEEDTGPSMPPPPPAARAPAGARPLPALNLQAARVAPKPARPPAPAQAARPSASRPASREPVDQGKGLMTSLFGEEDDAPAPARARPGAAARPAARQPATPGKPAGAPRPAAARPVAARAAAGGAGRGRPNDLRGPRKATVHFKDGASKRGTLDEFDLDADWIRLDPPAAGQGEAEELNALALKAIFLLLPPGQGYPTKQGTGVRLRMIDGRMLEGSSPDYHPQRKAFTLFPKVDQANIERVLVFNDAVKNIWLQEE